MKIIAYIFVVVSALLLTAPTVRGDDTQCPYHKLTWDDFKGPAPPEGSSENAGVYVGMKYSTTPGTPVKGADGKWRMKSKEVKVWSYIDKTQSGVQDGAKTDALLEHEQYHFDIAEAWARQTQKALEGIEGEGATPQEANADLNAKTQKAFDDAQKKCEEIQNKYDEETKHGTDAAKQAKWCQDIGKMLLAMGPNKDKGTSLGAYVQYDPVTKEVTIGQAPLSVFERGGQPFSDPYMQNGWIQFPSLAYAGHYMGSYVPLVMPPDAMDAQVTIRAGNGLPAVTGNLLLAMGSGNTISAWLQSVSFDPIAPEQSPFVGFMLQTLQGGKAYVVVEIRTPIPLEQASGFWTQPATIPATVHVGTRYELADWTFKMWR